MSRYRSGSITIDVSEVVDAISDDDLMDEVSNRRLVVQSENEPTDLDIVRDAYNSLLNGKSTEARCILERLLFPKWKSSKTCMSQYQKVLDAH